jgi:ClpP class serine protease
MNYTLAKEIHGNNFWNIDENSLSNYLNILNESKNFVENSLDIKANTPEILNADGTVELVSKEYQLDNNRDFNGIGIININGPILKSSGGSTLGMKDVSQMMINMSKDDRISAFILKVDSGGGASAAVEIMVDAINEVKQTKPVVALVEKGGLAASAAYGIISAADKIYVESGDVIVGSLGTMFQMAGREANSVDENGVKHIRLYATKSVNKNKGSEEALNNNNYDIIINDLLDPINENFLSLIESNRPDIKNINYNDGSVHFAKNVIGSFVDGIKSFSDVVESLLINNINLKTSKMTKEQFKSEHPEIFNEIKNEGIQSENNRVQTWLVHSKTDIDSVISGIESGNEISSVETQKFLVKQVQKSGVDALESDSAENVKTDAATGMKTPEQLEIEKNNKEIENSFDFELK